MYSAVLAPAPKPTLRSEIRVIAAVLACWLSVGCGGGDTRSLQLRRIVPDVDPACGAPADARTLLVTALGDFPPAETTARSRNISAGEEFAISSFPAATRVLNVEVIGNAGVVRTVGRTAEFDIEDLEDGDELNVFMAPPRGVCPTSAPVHARYAGLAARTSDGVIIAGGFDQDDMPVDVAERYDPRAGTFTALSQDVYGAPSLGLRGATFTSLADGRAVLAGGAETAWQLYDAGADTPGFQAARFLSGARAHHTSVALGADEIMLLGGCSAVNATTGACEPGSELLTTTIINASSEDVRDGPALTIARVGGRAVREADGRVVLVGGVDASGQPVVDGERIDPEGGAASETLTGVSGIPSRLVSDSLLTAFASSGATPTAAAAVLPPAETTGSPVTSAPAGRSSPTLTSLEDGRVLVVGGLLASGPVEALLYSPNQGRFTAPAGVPSSGGLPIHRSEHLALRLQDGSVLIVGGKNLAGDVLADAWVFRPDLTGPFTSDVAISFADPDLSALVVPRDPAQATIDTDGVGGGVEYVIDSTSSTSALPSQWAIVAGPQFVQLTASVRARAEAGGLAIMFSFRDAANYNLALFRAGQAVTVYQVRDGELTLVDTCTGQVIGADELRPEQAFADIELTAGAALTATVDGRPVLSCELVAPISRGHVGIGVNGDAGQVRLTSLSIRR